MTEFEQTATQLVDDLIERSEWELTNKGKIFSIINLYALIKNDRKTFIRNYKRLSGARDFDLPTIFLQA